MDPAFFAVVFVVALGAVPALWLAAIQRRAGRDRVAFWREAAGEAGLVGIELSGDRLTGCSGALQVRISSYQEVGEVRGTRVEIWSARLAPGLTLRPEPGGLLGSRNHKEIEVGDEDFDAQVSVQGPPALALALLDADMRRTVVSMLRGQLEVRGHRPLWASGQLGDGVLRIDVPERSPIARASRAAYGADLIQAGDAYLDGEYRLPEILRAALGLATRLLAPEDLARRIADNQASEPEPRVRLLGLLTLLREFPEHAATREAVGAAREDPDAEVRVRAGVALGADGRDVLLGAAGGEGAEDATSARAVTALGDSLTLEQARDFLKNALRTQRDATARACLKALGRCSGPEAIHTLSQVLAVESGLRRSPRRAIAIDAAAALADTGDASAEPALLAALGSPSTPLRIAAAQALGRVGTAAAVIPLREAEARDSDLRSAARQAIAEIHSRFGGAAPGQLSLAGGESGRLSIAEDETGHLSLSEQKGVRS